METQTLLLKGGRVGHSRGAAGSGPVFLSPEESRTKQFKAVKGILGKEKVEHPASDGWTSYALRAEPPSIARASQACFWGGSGLWETPKCPK